MSEKSPSGSRKRRRSEAGELDEEGTARASPPSGAPAQVMAQRLLQTMMAQDDINHRTASAAANTNRNSMGNFPGIAPPQGNNNMMDILSNERAAVFAQLLGTRQATSHQINTNLFSTSLLASLRDINPYLAATANTTGLGVALPEAIAAAFGQSQPTQPQRTVQQNSSPAPQPTPISDAQDTSKALPSALNEDERPPPGPGCKRLYKPGDESKTSPYQCLARQQLEFFAARKEDLDAGAQGRNRPIELGQVGVRCIWCASEPHRLRNKAFAYYPSKIVGIYQASQNIVNTHLCQSCHKLPHSIRQELLRLKLKKSGSGGGRKFWIQSAEDLGVVEAKSGGLRYAHEEENAEEGSNGNVDDNGAKESDKKPAAKK